MCTFEECCQLENLLCIPVQRYHHPADLSAVKRWLCTKNPSVSTDLHPPYQTARTRHLWVSYQQPVNTLSGSLLPNTFEGKQQQHSTMMRQSSLPNRKVKSILGLPDEFAEQCSKEKEHHQTTVCLCGPPACKAQIPLWSCHL